MPSESIQVGHARSSSLVDVLDRILDKGLVIAGDIKISIAEVELLTIRIRLMVCSIDKAEQIGLDWWKHDRHLSMGGDELAAENEKLKGQIRRLEQQLEAAPGTAQRAPQLRAKRLDRR
jgi:Gas vesicle protein